MASATIQAPPLVEWQEAGVTKARRRKVNVASGATVTDDAGGDRAVITITGGVDEALAFFLSAS